MMDDDAADNKFGHTGDLNILPGKSNDNPLLLTSLEQAADFWFYDLGVNVTPQPTQSRDPFKFQSWQIWQDKPIPVETYEQWKREGRFKNAEGIGPIPGRVWRGKHEGLYLAALDCDNRLAIKEFCGFLKDAPLQEIAQKFIIEHHDQDTYNPERMHAYFYSTIPLVGKSSDKKGPDAEAIDKNEKPAFEIKGEYPANGIMFASCSKHKSGECYRIIGTKNPVIFNAEQTNNFMKYIDEVCRKYGLEYFNTNKQGVRISKGLTAAQLFEEGSYTTEGHNRHNALLKMCMSIYNGMKGKLPLSTIKEICFKVINEKHCKPPIDRREFENNVWRSVLRYIPEDPEAERAAQREMELLANPDYEEPLRHLIVGDIDNKDEPRIFIEIRKSKDKNGKPIRCVQEFKLIPSINKETKQKFDVEVYGQKILDAVPVLPGDPDGKRIHVIYDPLFKVKKYKMTFEYIHPETGLVGRTEEIGPVTITELRHYLQEKTDFIVDSRPITGKLNTIIQACIENDYARYSEEIGPEGFFWYNGRIVSSKLKLRQPVIKESVRAIDILMKMQKQFYGSGRDKRRLAHYLKLFSVGCFEYLRKQQGWSKQYGWTPRGELTGDTRGGKSEYGRLACYMWRLNPDEHVLPKRSIDSEARVTYSLAQTTMTLTFQEPDFLFGANNKHKKETSDKILSTLKNSVEDLKGFRLTTNHERIDEHYLAHYIITHNSRPIAEDGISTRFIIDQFKKSDKKTDKEQIEKYTKFIYDNLDTIGCLGDFIGWYVCDINPEVLKQDWVSAAKKIWQEMFKFAGLEYQDWLDQTIQDSAEGGTGLSDTDLDDQRREMLRSSFQRMFNRLWETNRFEYNSSRDLNNGPLTSPTLIEQITWFAAKGKIPGCITHPTKGLCFTTAILDILQQNYGLEDDRIKFSDLEELCGFTPTYVRPTGGKNLRVHSVLPKNLAEFIRPILEVVGPGLAETDNQTSTKAEAQKN